MSRWLANVGQFLENLDNQAKDVVEERLVLASDKVEAESNEISGDKIDQILAERGLLVQNETCEEEDDEALTVSHDETLFAHTIQDSTPISDDAMNDNNNPTASTNVNELPDGSSECENNAEVVSVNECIDDLADNVQSPQINISNEDDTVLDEINLSDISGTLADTDIQTLDQKIALQQLGSTADKADTVADTEIENQEDPTLNETDKNGDSVTTSSPSLSQVLPAQSSASGMQAHRQNPHEEMVSISVLNTKLQEQASIRQSNEKEIRKLKRNVVSLNAHLEATEKEMIAQRKELENAAKSMEKDRSRNKEVLESLTSKTNTEIANLKMQHDYFMKDLQNKHDEQLRQMKEECDSLERIRRQEGGDYTKELREALQREQQVLSDCAMLVDEKETLLQQISTLQSQQESLGIRLESLSHNADMATERELEADRRLDEALEMHARQIGQRQVREAELERTVAELGAALVAVRSNSISSIDGTATNIPVSNATTDQTAGDATSQVDGDRQHEVVLQTMEHENDTLRLQLTQEAQRSYALTNELNELSKERSEETLLVTMKQQQHDKAIDDLNRQISQLKSDLREAKNVSLSPDRHSMRGSDEGEDVKRIKTLSEEILRQREKLSSYSSEISALRTRLNVALNRATVAEAVAEQHGAMGGGIVDMEGGKLPGNLITSGNSNFGTMTRRGRKEREGNDLPSMKKALMLENTYGQKSAKLAETLDLVDLVLVRVGRLLRLNPFVRLFFGTWKKTNFIILRKVKCLLTRVLHLYISLP